MKTNHQDPAYPITEEETDRIDEGIKIYSGLTKREYFAAMAMQGILASRQTNFICDASARIAALEAERCANHLVEILNIHSNKGSCDKDQQP